MNMSAPSQKPEKRLQLAVSPCPRTGGDAKKRQRAPVLGPTSAAKRRALPLFEFAQVIPLSSEEYAVLMEGSAEEIEPPVSMLSPPVVGENGAVYVLAPGALCCVDIQSVSLRWSCSLSHRSEESMSTAPLALAGGNILCHGTHEVFMVSPQGEIVEHWEQEDFLWDDSRISPNLTPEGLLLLGVMDGELAPGSPIQAPLWHGVFGYDVLAPTVYLDGSFAICAYASRGLCRVAGDTGEIVWQGVLQDADRVATVDVRGRCGAGSVNEQRSVIVDDAGVVLADWNDAGVFSVSPRGIWVFQSESLLICLDENLKELWRFALSAALGWGGRKPVFDAAGRVYAAGETELVSLAPSGELLWRVAVSGFVHGFALAGRGLLVAAVGGELIVFGDSSVP